MRWGFHLQPVYGNASFNFSLWTSLLNINLVCCQGVSRCSSLFLFILFYLVIYVKHPHRTTCMKKINNDIFFSTCLILLKNTQKDRGAGWHSWPFVLFTTMCFGANSNYFLTPVFLRVKIYFSDSSLSI